MEYGNLAQWVGAAASFSAVATALWLSGAEKRANRKAQRPILAVEDFSEADEDGWRTVRICFTNHSHKDWSARTVEVSKPKNARIIDQSECYKEKEGRSWDREFSKEVRNERAAKCIPLKLRLRPTGSTSHLGGGPSRTDIGWRTILLRVDKASDIELKFRFESLEPIPDSFDAKVIRSVV